MSILLSTRFTGKALQNQLKDNPWEIYNNEQRYNNLIPFITFLLVSLLAFVLISTVVFYLINGIAPTPSSYNVYAAFNARLPDSIRGDIVEAGAGFGGMALWLAHRYKGSMVYAWENAWVPFIVLWLRTKCSRLANVKARYGCFTHQPLDEVGLVYTFLCRKGMQKVTRWLECYPDTSLLLVSYVFMLPKRQPDESIKVSDWMGDQLYFYHITDISHNPS